MSAYKLSPRKLLLAAGLALAASVPAEAQTLVVCTEASPDFLNPQFSSQNTAYDVATQLYERLVATERGGSKLIPALAESWTVSPDGLAYTFKLRKGVKFHETKGFKPTRDFNADDVVFSFTRMMDANHPYNKVGGSNYQFFDSIVKAHLDKVERIDDLTVKLTLKQPYTPLLSALSVDPMSILSAEYAAALTKAGTQDLINTQPVGTGPFYLLAYQKDATVRMRAFPEHWAKKAGDKERSALVDNLVFVITPDASVRYAKLKAGECHILRYPAPGDLPAIRQDANLKIVTGSVADMSFLAFNQQKKPFDDKRVREALVYGTNVKAIVEAVYLDTGKQTASLIPPAFASHLGIAPRPYDPEKAKKLLAEAGFPNGFETELWALPVVRAYMPNGRRAAELIQADWAKIGVKATITTYEWGEYLKRGRQGDHQVGMFGYTWDYPDPSQILLSGWNCRGVETGANRARWCNKEFSDLLDKANTISDEAERDKMFRRMQEIFQEDVGGLLFANAQVTQPVRKDVENYKLHFFGGQPYTGVSLAK